MPKAEWGVKRLCSACGARFYDLGREEAECPKCGAAFIAASAMAERAKAAVAKADEEEDEVVEEVVEKAADADVVDDDDIAIDADSDDDDDDIGDDVLLESDDDDDLGDFTGGPVSDDEKET